jgi:hypothetical protein
VNERLIQKALFRHFHGRYSVFLPNFTPPDWFECDMFGITKHGYAHEFEIKVSVGDFLADARKKVNGVVKHDQIGKKGPVRFWYVMPELVADLVELPDWAGLMFVKEIDGRPFLFHHRKAPLLHRAKADPSVIRQALQVCYHRYWRERERADRLVEENRDLRLVAFPAGDHHPTGCSSSRRRVIQD